MENVSNNADKLIARILSEATAEGDALKAKSQEACEKIRSDGDKIIAQNAQTEAEARKNAVQGVLDGARTRAALDGRKEALSFKRSLMDEAFVKAEKAVHTLAPEKRRALLKALLAQEGANGDVVKPAGADREVVAALVSESNLQLTLSPENAPYEGGFQLLGGSYEKDCSLSSVLTELRSREETNVAKILFAR